jgi:PHD/YefM family antitoxin component YafN of YafNO toxin-antitoxin module
MVRTISRQQYEADATAILDAVCETREPVIIESDGIASAVMISPDEYERFRREQLERDWAVIQQVQERNADKDPDEVLRDVTAVVEEVRQELYDERQRERRRSH